MLPLNGDLPREALERLAQYDTCTLSNAIERLDIRPRNEGFVTGAVTCRFPQLAPVIGYAVTARMRSSTTPVNGKCYYQHPELWNYIAESQGPRILVIHDSDHLPGMGALLGEAYARISRALGCVACITDGAVRDLKGIEALGYQVFAGSVAVSHAYAHVVDFGAPVEIGGLTISTGDLLHGDRHGVHMIPHAAAPGLADIADQVLRDDRELFEFIERKDFSVAALSDRLERANRDCL